MEVKRLVELVESLISEFQAVKLELEASRVDVDSIRGALCEFVGSTWAVPIIIIMFSIETFCFTHSNN